MLRRLPHRWRGVFGAAVAIAIASATPAYAASPAGVAAELTRDPVYVEAGADPTLSVPDRGRLRVQVARQDIGRVKIAVVTAASARRAGGVERFSKAVDRELPAKGNLIVVGGPTIHLITSYAPAGPATDALRRGVQDNNDRSLADRLSAGIEGIAKVDPGASGDLDSGGSRSAPPGSFPAVEDATNSVVSTLKLVLFIVAGVIALPFLVGALYLLTRIRRRRRDEAEELAAERESFRREIVALGDQIRELDLDVEMPDADPEGRAQYERALAVYDEANAALTMRRSASALKRARAALDEGQQRMAEARRLLEAQLGSNRAPVPEDR